MRLFSLVSNLRSIKSFSTVPQNSFPNVCIIGAGISGLCAATQLKSKLGLNTFTIFDANKDVGGTWFVNKYPGCACDVHSHLYSFSYELNPNWSQCFSSSQEIHKYLKGVAEKYDLYPRIKFRRQVKTLEWDEVIRKWKVTIDNLDGKQRKSETEIFDIVINGPGSLRVPNYPEQFKSFKGPIIHSAEWDSSVDLKNKVVAVIGNGSSGLQIVPAIADKVKEMHVYQRNPSWIIPKEQFTFGKQIKFLFDNVPFLMRLYRLLIYTVWESYYPAFVGKSKDNKKREKLAMDFMRKQLGDNEKLIKDLTPNYEYGCKRLGVSSDYYPCFTKANVKLHRSKIVDVTENTVSTENGVSTKADVLILATGFKFKDYFAPMQIIGEKKEKILETWKNDVPSAYFGILTHPAPNHFMLLGPYSFLANNSVIYMSECQVNYIVKVIEEMMKRGSKCVTVKAEEEKEHMNDLRQNLKSMVWSTGNCKAWYSNDKGEVTALWPLPSSKYWWRTRNVDFSKLKFS